MKKGNWNFLSAPLQHFDMLQQALLEVSHTKTWM